VIGKGRVGRWLRKGENKRICGGIRRGLCEYHVVVLKQHRNPERDSSWVSGIWSVSNISMSSRCGCGSGVARFVGIGCLAHDFSQQHFFTASITFDGVSDELQYVSAYERASRPVPHVHHKQHRSSDETRRYSNYMQS